MSTVVEIEKLLPELSTEALLRLDGAVDATLRSRRKVFTGHDAVRWWEGRERMTAEEADAFAADVEAGRREANRPPEARPLSSLGERHALFGQCSP